MPSNLPIIKANTSHENISKMKVIAKQNKRSISKELEWLIEKHIEEYEKENGEIILEEKKGFMEQVMDIGTDKSKSLAEKSKESFKLGYEKGLGKK